MFTIVHVLVVVLIGDGWCLGGKYLNEKYYGLDFGKNKILDGKIFTMEKIVMSLVCR